MSYSYSDSLTVRLKYLDRHIAYMEKEVAASKQYRERLVQEREKAQQKELHNDISTD